MESHIIYSKSEDSYCLIVHAYPGAIGEFQWYLTDDPNGSKRKMLKRQTYESITFTSEQIQEGYEGKWLCCRCNVNGYTYDEGCLYLISNFIDMIQENQFQSISFFDENGWVRGSKYIEKEDKELGNSCRNNSLGIDKNASYCKIEQRNTTNPQYIYEVTFDFFWNGWNYNLEVQMPTKYKSIEEARQNKNSCRFEKRDGHVILVIYTGWEQGMKNGKWYEHIAGEELAVYRWEDWHLWKMTKKRKGSVIDDRCHPRLFTVYRELGYIVFCKRLTRRMGINS